jgi:glycosyltransferase involved in cell wall biosynthesis
MLAARTRQTSEAVRVALVDPPSYTPPYDHALASALAARSHDVDLLTSRFLFGSAPKPDGYARDELFLPLSARLLAARPRSRARAIAKGLDYVPSTVRVLRRLDALRPDVVHVQWLPLPRYDRAWLRRAARRYPTVLTAHDVFPRRSGQLRAWGEALGLVDRIVVHSDRAVEQLVAVGVDRTRLVRILHPVFEASNDRVAPPPRGETLLFFGLIRAYKGLDVLIRALAEVARRVSDVRLVVAGDPMDAVAPLRELAAELGVDERIEWRLRYVADEELLKLMDEAALVALPYRDLDSSGALATALGYGRPVVVTDVGSLGNIVREFRCGGVVPPDDASALAEACVELLADPAALDAAFRGTADARRALTWEAAAAEHERVYEAAVLARGVRA